MTTVDDRVAAAVLGAAATVPAVVADISRVRDRARRYHRRRRTGVVALVLVLAALAATVLALPRRGEPVAGPVWAQRLLLWSDRSTISSDGSGVGVVTMPGVNEVRPDRSVVRHTAPYDGLVSLLAAAVTPDGRLVVLAMPPAELGGPPPAVRLLVYGPDGALTGSRPVRMPVPLSRDVPLAASDTNAYVGYGAEVVAIDLATGALRPTPVPLDPQAPNRTVLSAAGGRLAHTVPGDPCLVRVRDERSEALLVEVRLGLAGCTAAGPIRLSPDGTRLAATASAGDRSRVELYELAGGQLVGSTLEVPAHSVFGLAWTSAGEVVAAVCALPAGATRIYAAEEVLRLPRIDT